jgi:hypothetical protein
MMPNIAVLQQVMERGVTACSVLRRCSAVTLLVNGRRMKSSLWAACEISLIEFEDLQSQSQRPIVSKIVVIIVV